MLAAGALLSLSAFTLTGKSEAATSHTVSSGQTYWTIAKGFGIPIDSLETANHYKSLYAGETITLPNAKFSSADKALLARLVHAEASGEPYAGKVAVATVVLNRVLSSQFPDTIPGVINQVSNGYYAFTPVKNGQINHPADADSKRAVNEAIALIGKGSGSLFFYNPSTATSSFDASRTVTVKIGHHVFAK
ncbi:cell wall hydrolase [Pullulanibacillus sp. KACC 23026]|uniref:cell wall hydrolase n=1 Tax=Pullulanibacillus sp. KACC 23026 TaxID=3028315 RepID=UPI0023AFA102|nr:cell wall hydrolase [Pullulanibacillus sp. KACC 23026]WEG14942.1 cell wall hydrolase [Pullulanibacillus sp. KACC 23026]